MKTGKTSRGADLKLTQIQIAANNQLNSTFSNFRNTIPDILWRIRSEEDQLEKGIDFQFEVENIPTAATQIIFKVQNKGTDKIIRPLKGTKNKGKIAFQIGVRHIRYYRDEINFPVVFTICDLKRKLIYWHSIQLDDVLDEMAAEAVRNNKKTIQIYISPNNVLNEQNLERFMSEIKESQLQQSERFNSKIAKFTAFVDQVNNKIDRSKHIVDQLYEMLNYILDEINFLPPAIISKLYPIVKDKSSYSHYSCFTVTTDNDELFSFLKSITLGADGKINYDILENCERVENHEEKIRYILKRLTQNLIFNVTSRKTQETIELIHVNELPCDCTRCNLARLQFAKLFDQLSSEDPSKKMETIYMHYRLGNYLTAYYKYKDFAGECLRDKKYTLYFLCMYNLSHLGRFIYAKYWGESERPEIVAELRKINLDAVLRKIKSKVSNYEFLERVRTGLYIEGTKERINILVSKLRDD